MRTFRKLKFITFCVESVEYCNFSSISEKHTAYTIMDAVLSFKTSVHVYKISLNYNLEDDNLLSNYS
jgi:hypothetical protein